MSAASSTESGPRLTQSPLWSSLVDDLESQIAGRQLDGPGPTALDAAASASARAHSHLLVALESGSSTGEATVSELVAEAVELLIGVAKVWATFGTAREDRRPALAEQLRQRLAAHEDAVLAGEVTYSVWAEQAEEPAGRIRRAITCLSGKPSAFHGDLLSLTIAAVDLASLLLRLAANAAASGRAGEAPEERSAALDAKLRAVTGELAARAQEVERPVSDRADIAAHHLAAGLRVRFSQEVLHRLRAGAPEGAVEPTALEGLRDAWLGLATNQYVAVSALDAQLDTPAYDQRLGDLSSTIVEAAANVICGARLVGRPGAFRHGRAWRHQAVALTYALEAYVAGLRGHAPSLAQAQLIALTRLVRATVAIALIDLTRADALSHLT